MGEIGGTVRLDEVASTRQVPRFRVVVEAGPERGAEVLVEGDGEVLVGQSPVCALRLSDVSVSRRHLALEVAGARLRVRDLASTNETYVQGVSVREARLAGGERIRIGNTTLQVLASGVSHQSLPSRQTFGEITTDSRAMARLFPTLEQLARSPLPVLIEGETGTGKEVLARSIHMASPRNAGPLIVFDCAAVAASVIESELFGHEKGAFTGAVGMRRGCFEQAHGGTIFIDELGELPLDLQPKLLRALERSEVHRVGGNQWIACDVRVVAATRRNMDEMVTQGRFRDDLFHRLAVGRVELPPLRERREDIPLLVDRFLQQGQAEGVRIPSHVLRDWTSRPWPGNVRELRNAVYRFVTLGEDATVDAQPDASADGADVDETTTPTLASGDGESEIDAVVRQNLPYAQARERIIKTFEQRYVEKILARHDGSVVKAAKSAGLSTKFFQMLLSRGAPKK